MIRSFADKDTEKLANRERVRRFQQIEKIAQRKLLILNQAKSLADLKSGGNHLEFHDRFGPAKGRYTIRISDKWRIAFRWESADAYDVEIMDYH